MLNMAPEDALFVVFRNQPGEKSRTLPEKTDSLLVPLSGEWEVTFQPDRGAPEKAVFKELTALSVKVTNLWVNRLIGDQQPGVTHPVTYTTQPFYRADSPLLPSGLMGPVNIFRVI